MTLLWQRILVEKRAMIVPLVARRCSSTSRPTRCVVYPLGVEVGRRRRPRRRGGAVAAGRRARARRGAGRSSPASRAPIRSCDLLRQGAAGRPVARRADLTYATLPALARRSERQDDRSPLRGRAKPREERAARPAARSTRCWQGDYESFRQFIYALESALAVRDHRRRDAGAERSGQAADADARALDLLSAWDANGN